MHSCHSLTSNCRGIDAGPKTAMEGRTILLLQRPTYYLLSAVAALVTTFKVASPTATGLRCILTVFHSGITVHDYSTYGCTLRKILFTSEPTNETTIPSSHHHPVFRDISVHWSTRHCPPAPPPAPVITPLNLTYPQGSGLFHRRHEYWYLSYVKAGAGLLVEGELVDGRGGCNS